MRPCERLLGSFSSAMLPLASSRTSRAAVPALLALALAVGGCSKSEPSGASPGEPVAHEPVKVGTPPPPPAATGPGAAACVTGGGQVGDPVSAGVFPRTFTAGGAAWCVDPQEETRTYGEQAKFSMDDVCTTALDGECEVYKRFGLKRFVAVRYVDGGGAGGQGQVYLSRFADPGGAYGMFTKRVVADGDPADPSAPRPLDAKSIGAGAAALGTGRGYLWKGEYLAELEYSNENESPEQLTASSAAVLTALASAMGPKLSGAVEKPAAARLLPSAGLVNPNAIQYFPKEVPGLGNVGPLAIGFYSEGGKRYRLLSMARDDAEQAKAALKAVRGAKGASGAQPVVGLFDEATSLTLQRGEGASKANYVFARKGPLVGGAGDEEQLLAGPAEKQAAARLSKDDAVAKVREWLGASEGTSAAKK